LSEILLLTNLDSELLLLLLLLLVVVVLVLENPQSLAVSRLLMTYLIL